MRMKKVAPLFVVFFLLAWQSEVVAQQQSQFTQYMFNTNAVNPAYAGSRGTVSALSLYRMQWVGFEGAPNTIMFNINSPFLNDKIGAGITIINEKVGPIKQTGIFSDFVFKIAMKKSSLSFGLKAGADIFQANFSSINTVVSDDVQFQSDISSALLPNFGFGLYYKTEKYYFGISAPKLVQNKVDIATGNSSLTQLEVNKIHYYLIGGYVMNVNPFVKFKPTVQVKFAYGAPVSIDANASFLFYEKLWLGAMLRPGDAVGALLQYQFTPQFRVGYSYDFTVSELRKYNNGTHEIMLGYDFNSGKEKIRSPRYF